jgi:type IV pilus assembly protein PilP
MTSPMRTLSLALIGLSLVATCAYAQAAPPASPAPAPAASASAAQSAQTPVEKTQSAVEPQGFTYNPEGRRDPFVSLLLRGTDNRNAGAKVAGLGGLGTSEVSLRGTMVSQGAFVGILQGVDTKNYIVRVGDKLSDGTVRTITADSMVILQQVNDPLSLEKQREVRKLLRQTEEAK